MQSKLATVTLTLVLLAVCAHAQDPSDPAPPPTRHMPASANTDAKEQETLRAMAKKANLEREAALKRDTDKLVLLTTQLKEYVDKTNENVLAVDVIRKAEEIEKLAHNVKDKMKGPN